jgi:hypothetical protein
MEALDEPATKRRKLNDDESEDGEEIEVDNVHVRYQNTNYLPVLLVRRSNRR